MPRVADLVSRIQRYGHLPANNWKISFGRIGPDEALQGMYSIADTLMPDGETTRQTFYNRMSLSCDSVNVPGRSIASIVDGGIGVGAEQPYAKFYEGDLTVGLLIGREAYERKVFEEWMDQIAHPRSGRLSYYKNYVCDAELTLFDRQDIPRYKVIFEEVYPKTVSPIQLSNDNPDLIKQQVDFAYRLYRPVNLNTGGEFPDEFSTELLGLHTQHALFNILNNGLGTISEGVSALGSAIGKGVEGLFGRSGSDSETKEAVASNGRVLDLSVYIPSLRQDTPWFNSNSWTA